MWLIKFTNGGIPYYQGTGIHGHVWASDFPDHALQFATKEEAEKRLPILGIDGGYIPARVEPVPVWAIN